MSKAWDVIVIGGGPGGALAARKCAAGGLRTLLLEKKKMPRDKCCSGMVMGPWGQDLVRREFGDYPDEVLRETTHLLGYALHAMATERPVPWHRVMNARGEVSVRSEPGGDSAQRAFLEREGVVFDRSGRIDLARFQWRPRGVPAESGP